MEAPDYIFVSRDQENVPSYPKAFLCQGKRKNMVCRRKEEGY